MTDSPSASPAAAPDSAGAAVERELIHGLGADRLHRLRPAGVVDPEGNKRQIVGLRARKVFRLAQTMQVGPCIYVGIQL